MYFLEVEDLYFVVNCEFNDLFLILLEIILLNMFEGCNICSLLKFDFFNVCSVD